VSVFDDNIRTQELLKIYGIFLISIIIISGGLDKIQKAKSLGIILFTV